MDKIVVVRKTFHGDPDRYVVVDKETGELLDDAQGYGFKSKQKAYAAYAYKHGGGKERELEYAAFWQKRKEIVKYIDMWFDINFKELAREEVSLFDLKNDIKMEFDEIIPIPYIKKYDMVRILEKRKKKSKKNKNKKS